MLSLFTIKDRTGMFFIKIFRSISHTLQIRFVFQIIGDQRPAIDRIFFCRDDGNRTFSVHAADSLDAAGSSNSVSDNYILFHLISPHTQLPG